MYDCHDGLRAVFPELTFHEVQRAMLALRAHHVLLVAKFKAPGLKGCKPESAYILRCKVTGNEQWNRPPK